MTRIDFYVLPALRLDAREQFAARLAAKAVRAGQRALLLCDDEAARARLAERLWGLPGAFMPSAPLRAPEASAAPILLALESELDAHGTAPFPMHEWLINLRLERSAHFAAFDRVAEIICQDDAVREAGRAHYRFYRERGYPLHHHDLKDREA